MKTTIAIVMCAFLAIGAISCNDGKNKKFNPEDRTSSMSDAERQKAIAEKKAASAVDISEMLSNNDVKMSVLPPAVSGDITDEISDRITVQMLKMISENGIGGLNTVPGFALAAAVTPGDRKTTGTAPQRMIVNYTLSYKVVNTVTGDVYGACEEEITGAGGSFQEATRNAVKNIKNTGKTKKMLAAASTKIIDWFNNNLGEFQRQVNAACGEGNYALALALIESVPQKASAAFDYARGCQQEIIGKFRAKIAQEEMSQLKAAIATSGDEISPEVYAHLQMLPDGSPEYKEAEKLVSGYETRVFAAKSAKEQREWSKEDIAAERAHQLEQAKITADVQKAKYEAKASAEAMRAEMRSQEDNKKGFWSGLGSRILNGIDHLSGKLSGDDWD